MVTLVEWETVEYHHTHKSADWYWAVGIVALTGAILSFMLGSFVFALFIIFGALALCIHAAKPPQTIRCEVASKGIVVHDTLFPYTTIDSFWVETIYNTSPKLIIKSKKFFMPFITIIISDIDPEHVRGTLLAYLKEEEHQEPFGQRVMEYLGF